MASVNVEKAAVLVGKSKATIWRWIRTGKLSAQADDAGVMVIDTSELLRVFGAFRFNDSALSESASEKKSNCNTASLAEMQAEIRHLQAQAVLREELLKTKDELIATLRLMLPAPSQSTPQVLPSSPDPEPDRMTKKQRKAASLLGGDVKK